MNLHSKQPSGNPFNALRGLARRRDPAERCDLCGAGLTAEHQHLFEPAARKLLCSCDACSILFPGDLDTKYQRVPRRVRLLRAFQLPDEQWDSLMVPTGMAYFVHSSVEKRVLAFYPSPAGPTESLLSLESWNDIVGDNPVLAGIQSDVEALLVNRLSNIRREGNEYYLAPIDKCYELVGLIRFHWRGLSGGTEVWQEVQRFFDGLRERSAWGASIA